LFDRQEVFTHRLGRRQTSVVVVGMPNGRGEVGDEAVADAINKWALIIYIYILTAQQPANHLPVRPRPRAPPDHNRHRAHRRGRPDPRSQLKLAAVTGDEAFRPCGILRQPDSQPASPYINIIIISGAACSTGGVHSQTWSTSDIGLGSKSGRG
jgi:hypothetical protein